MAGNGCGICRLVELKVRLLGATVGRLLGRVVVGHGGKRSRKKGRGRDGRGMDVQLLARRDGKLKLFVDGRVN